MADTIVDGEPAISARTVSFWQGFAEMSKMVGMFAGVSSSSLADDPQNADQP